LHVGRRDVIIESLFVHPQTVRYRMTQLRQLYGDSLDDPNTILELTVAHGLTGGRASYDGYGIGNRGAARGDCLHIGGPANRD
jgi:hypothetical protein